MIPLSSPLNHTNFCDGRNTAEEMVIAALENHFISFGFSEHAKQNFDPKYSLDDQREQRYIEEIKRLQHIYNDRIALHLGIERDYYSTADRTLFEYVIGSVHYLPKKDGQLLSVDGDREQILEAIADTWQGSGIAYAKAYYQLFAHYISDYQPDIIGHFDLLTKFNRKQELFDEDSTVYQHLVFETMDQILPYCSLMEVNTGAIARSGAKRPYPNLKILDYWRKHGGDVILSADCHNAADLTTGYETGLAFIRKAGFEKIMYLGCGEALFDEFVF